MTNDLYMDKLTLDLLLDSLSRQDKDIIVLWFIDGYNLNEIATIIRKKYLPKRSPPIRPRVIGLRIHKILEKLREHAGVTQSMDTKGHNIQKNVKI